MGMYPEPCTVRAGCLWKLVTMDFLVVFGTFKNSFQRKLCKMSHCQNREKQDLGKIY